MACSGDPASGQDAAVDGDVADEDTLAADATEDPEVVEDTIDDVAPDAEDDTHPDTERDTQPDADEDVAADVTPTERVPGCESYGEPIELADLPAGLDEISGLALASTTDLLWMHNDSGSQAFLYAVNAFSGNQITRAYLVGEPALDWEDIAAGPCGPGSPDRCLYVADFGDNSHMRRDVGVHARIHRVPEPSVESAEVDVESWDTMLYQYSDGVAHNAEALVVDEFGRVFVLTKDADGTFGLFGAPFEPNTEPVDLPQYGTHDITMLPATDNAQVTGADYDPSTGRLIVRGYTGVLEYQLADDTDLTSLGDVTARIVPNGLELQGEAIVYGDGGYYTVSEANRPPIYYVGCED